MSARWPRLARRWPEVALPGALVGLAFLVTWLAVGGPAPRAAPRPPAVPSAPAKAAPAPASAPRPVDPGRIRDVFRFADEPGIPTPAEPAVDGSVVEAAPNPAPDPSGPRLVGLVRRAGRLVAALAADGEVVLAGPGETAAGVTVLLVGEDGVRVRHADGREETLLLP